MFSSVVTPIASGSAMTLVLLYVMQLLVSLTPAEAPVPRAGAELGFVRIPRPEDPPALIEPLIDRKIPQPPVTPPMLPPGTTSEPVLTVPSPPPQEPGPYRPAQNLPMADGPLVALVYVKPNYPPAAAIKGLEGQVLLEFDVAADGRVENIVVIESSHTVFEAPAIRAANRFRYKPRVVNGQAIPTPRVRTLLTFRLE